MKTVAMVVLIVLVLVGCSEKPSDIEIEKLFRDAFIKAYLKEFQNMFVNIPNFDKDFNFKGIFDSVVDIKNIEIIDGTDSGSKNTYTAIVRYDLVLKHSLPDAQDLATRFAVNYMFGNGVQPGATYSDAAKLKFLKTEKGWVVTTLSSPKHFAQPRQLY